MRLLLTNDDGIDAPGLQAAHQAIRGLGETFVVAPAGAQSGVSHRVTLEGMVGSVDHGGHRFAVHGTPADCVRLGLHHLTGPVDWVISGINEGGNLGVDIHHSGTVAAVREAVIHGLKGIAISQYKARDRQIDWGRSAHWASKVIAKLVERPIPPETFWNVNLPHPGPEVDEPEVVYCQTDPSPLPLAYHVGAAGATYNGVYQSRPRRPGRDVDVCFGGRIAISLVHVMASVEEFG